MQADVKTVGQTQNAVPVITELTDPHLFPHQKQYPLMPKVAAAATAKSLQSCPTSCDPIDGSPPDSPIPGILQARTLEWVAISFSNAWKWKWSRVQLFTTPWTAAYQASPSMGFSRQECWSGAPSPSLSQAPTRQQIGWRFRDEQELVPQEAFSLVPCSSI